MLYTEDKPFSAKFPVDYKIFSLIYICYKYKFPLSFFLTMYEMYGESTLFTFKALSCVKNISLTDNSFVKIIEQSKILYKQILSGISTNIKRDYLSKVVKHGGKIKEIIPDEPKINLSQFNEEYREFISNYFLKNIQNIFSDELELKFNTTDLYTEILK